MTTVPVFAETQENNSAIEANGLSGELPEEELQELYDWDSDIMDLEQALDPNQVTDSKQGEQANAAQKPAGAEVTIQTRAAGQWIQEADGRWWYRHSDGGYTTNGWELIDGKWYYFDSEGWMVTGWINDGGTWYYCDASGAMLTGWIKVGADWYYCNSSGAMQTGWIQLDGLWYYLDSDGRMMIGWELINGKWYYMNDSGILIRGWFNDGQKNYYSDESTGEWIDNTGTRMIQDALQFVGNPYVWGGNSLTNGVDCSGYTQQIHLRANISIPRVSSQQYASSKKVAYSNLQPGDLVFYGYDGVISHVAFYMGQFQNEAKAIVHAADSQHGIITSSINRSKPMIGYGTYWR